MLAYSQSSNKEKIYFKKQYNELVIEWSKEKIKQLLVSPFKSWEYDDKSIKFHVDNIISIEPDFNFGIFNNNYLDTFIA
jgi:hypothetical protein